MKRTLVLLGGLAACSRAGSSDGQSMPAALLDEPATPTGPSVARPVGVDDGSPTQPVTTGLTPADACDRFRTLAAERCDWTARFPAQFHDSATCEGSLEQWFAPATAGRVAIMQTVGCWALDCDAAAACMIRAQQQAAPPAARACGDEGTAPIMVDAEAWARRRGAGVTKFSQLATSEAAPVELCGHPAELEWIGAVTCDDGSTPMRDPDAAAAARAGYYARGGTCNSILNRYLVKCPEATYTVHLDRYVCPLE